MRILSAPHYGHTVPLRRLPGPKNDPPEQTPSRLLKLAQTSAHHVGEVARWTEVDDLGALFLGAQDPRLGALNAWDGLVTVYDGQRILRQGGERGDRSMQAGGAMRVGLGMAGMWPGPAGFVAEAALGAYCLAEGAWTRDRETAVIGLTQLGSSLGMAAAGTGIGGHLGQVVSGVSLIGRLAYLLKTRQS